MYLYVTFMLSSLSVRPQDVLQSTNYLQEITYLNYCTERVVSFYSFFIIMISTVVVVSEVCGAKVSNSPTVDIVI